MCVLITRVFYQKTSLGSSLILAGTLVVVYNRLMGENPQSPETNELPRWQSLTPELASQAVSTGFIHFLKNSLTCLSLRGVPREIVSPMNLSSHEIGKISASTPKEAIRLTAQAIVLKIRDKIRQGFLLPEDIGNPEENWFAKVRNNYISRMGEEDKTKASNALASIKNQWENLFDLANPEKPIALPLKPADEGLDTHFDTRAPRSLKP